ncbi:SEC-C domain-containing protein [Acinetobacter pittii]|uniref:SEC-C domain-containing protein n=1 Tax=Acinetobacter pittii TaxID=48296 RepID=UPI003260DEA8
MAFESIIVSNFPTRIGSLSLIQPSRKKKENFEFRFLGFINSEEYKTFLENTLEKLFSSLLLYKKIYINDKDFLKVMSFIGVEDSIALLETGKIRLTHTYQEPHVIAHYPTNKLNTKIYYEIEPIQYIPALIYVEKNYSVFSENLFLREKLLKYLENAYIDINDFDKNLYPSAIEIINKIENYNLKNMKFSETFKLFRQYEIAQSFNLKKKYHIHDNLLDAYSNDYLQSKLPLYNNQPLEKIELFESVVSKKKIPNFFTMYRDGILKIQDFLDICDNAHTKKFSEWLFDPKVTEETILYELTKPQEADSLIKYLRFTLVSMISLYSPALVGMVASLVDLLIPEKQKSWHPSLFLDHVLDKRLSNIKEYHLREREKNEIYERFKSINGDQICPCLKKGKKYKDCCGASRVL